MKNKSIFNPRSLRWFLYTVCVGSLPILIRLFIYFLVEENSLEIISIGNVAFFGLVLHISNLNQMEYHVIKNETWRQKTVFTSLMFVIIFSIIFTLYFIDEATMLIIDAYKLQVTAILMTVLTLIYSISVNGALSSLKLKP